ncbi:MAG: DUF11 domain-containing protein [Flavobacteriales bacterium]|nr:DUF11 domain-containing protein [Flavobacteriales bacterium]
MDYTIRFQNTGTDTAFLVVVTDTLPATLDHRTFRNREPRLTRSRSTSAQDAYSNGAFRTSCCRIATSTSPGAMVY